MRRAGAALGVVLLLAGAFTLSFFLTQRLVFEGDQARALAPVAVEPAVPDLALPEAERVRRQVASILERSYISHVEPEVLEAETVTAMLDALGDPYTEYLTPEEYAALRTRTDRSYSGVGLTVRPAEKGLIVTSALNGPARDVGIRPGDIILRIDGKPARRLSFEQSLALIKGDEGTFVRLTVRLKDGGRVKFTVMRQNLQVPAIRKKMRYVDGARLGYIRVLSFPANVAERMSQATERLIENGAEGLILDLRDNPGGLLNQAVRIASLYLGSGVICRVDGRHRTERVLEASGNPSYPDIPLVVLVNGGTASAAELFAAALSYHGRGVLVGGRTFGKATVQSIRELENEAALKLTTATYKTPSGRDVTGFGVIPEIATLDDPLTRQDEALTGAAEALVQEIARRLRLTTPGLAWSGELLSPQH